MECQKVSSFAICDGRKRKKNKEEKEKIFQQDDEQKLDEPITKKCRQTGHVQQQEAMARANFTIRDVCTARYVETTSSTN